MEEVRLEREQVETAIMMYLKEVRGITFARVADVRWPCFTPDGQPGAIIAVKPAEAPDPGSGI